MQKFGETAKISARNSRRDANAMLKALQKDGDLTEDELKKSLDKVQGMTDEATGTIDGIIGRKQEDDGGLKTNIGDPIIG